MKAREDDGGVFTKRSISLGLSLASFAALLQMLQMQVPAVPAPLGVAAVAFMVSMVLGVAMAFMIELWSSALDDDLPQLRRPGWVPMFFFTAAGFFVLGAFCVALHVYPGRLAWIALLVSSFASLILLGRMAVAIKEARAKKGQGTPGT